MSEENKVIYCNNCGGENPETFKFCSNCGTKLEVVQPDNPMQPVYEKVEAEIVENTEAVNVEEEQPPVFEEELHINYEKDNHTFEQAPTPAQTQYYASGQSVEVTGSNGNIGFSIASMVCGILSLLCCCSGFFGFVLAVGAVVLGIIAIKNNYDGKGMAIAGLITGGICVLFVVLMLIIGGFSDILTEMLDEIANY